MSKICVGMFRPRFEDLKDRLQKEDWTYFHCRCLGPQIAGIEYSSLVDHWLLGHFDEPVYREVVDD